MPRRGVPVTAWCADGVGAANAGAPGSGAARRRVPAHGTPPAARVIDSFMRRAAQVIGPWHPKHSAGTLGAQSSPTPPPPPPPHKTSGYFLINGLANTSLGHGMHQYGPREKVGPPSALRPLRQSGASMCTKPKGTNSTDPRPVRLAAGMRQGASDDGAPVHRPARHGPYMIVAVVAARTHLVEPCR